MKKIDELKVAALAGGVGGAKLIVGLRNVLPEGQLTAIVNTGDDFEHFGLRICPDLDTVCYSLAGVADALHGWGVKDETWHVLDQLRQLEAPSWFALGDRDLALHLERTRLLAEGNRLTLVTKAICRKLEVSTAVLPMCDQAAPTLIRLKDGRVLGFQEYFVGERFEPLIDEIILPEASNLSMTTEVAEALRNADLIVICPSNPWVSIAPILNVPGVREQVSSKIIIAVSPIINGAALKGPAAKMFAELGIEASASNVLAHYGELVDGFVYDNQEDENLTITSSKGIILFKTNTIMKETHEKNNLAVDVLCLGSKLFNENN